MKFRMPGATAIAAVLVAIAAPAPLAFAQNGQAAAPPPVSRVMITPLNDARAAIVAKDWPTVTVKLEGASKQAKTPVDRAAIEQLRLAMAIETKDSKQQIASINALIASGTLTPDEMKQYKGGLAKAHLDAGDQPASLAAYRAYIDEFGGTADQYIGIANDYSKANDHATSVIYAEKAITAARANGKPLESWYRLQLRSLNLLGQFDKYNTLLETVVGEYPKETYWKELIARAQNEPKFGAPMKLDLFRALGAAGVKLSAQERSMAADEALKRGLPNEALTLLEAAQAAGELTTEFDKTNLSTAKSQAASDKAGLAKETTDALAKGSASDLALTGEALLSYGDNAKAAELLQAAVAKGISDPLELAAVKLHLGIAQYRAGQKDAARATWAEVKTDNGAGMLAHNWTLISKLIP